MLTRTDRLPGCMWCHARPTRCDRCDRLHAIGLLVDALVMLPYTAGDSRGVVPGATWLACLDAVAFLLRDRAALRHRHQKELRDEQLGAQRDARAAHDDGLAEGRRSVGDW